MNWYRSWGKRAFDLSIAIPLLLLSAPVFLAVWAMVRIFLGAPAFFVQERPGLGGRSFWMVKFRTMTNDRDQQGNLLPNDQRLTGFGRFLRATSLDELPELWNVVKGDMSLVGPRPLLVKYLDRYTPEQARRHEALPGVTGWAQVNGRNQVSWEEKFAMDVWYVDNMSAGLDLQILTRTLTSVLKRDGISAAGHATAPEFNGSPPRARGEDDD